MHLWSVNLLIKKTRLCDEEKTVSSINGAGKTEQLHIKKIKLEHPLTPYKKRNSKWIKDLNVRLDTIKLLKENIERTHFNIHQSNSFFSLSPRVMEIKNKNKWDLIKLKSFCTARETISKTKRQPIQQKKMFANNVTDKELICKVYK